jgi:hypothetical protein
MAKRKSALAVVPVPATLRLDFGCGPHKREGFEGVDSIAFPGVDHVLNVVQRVTMIGQLDPRSDQSLVAMPTGYAKWPWADNSVAEAHASHFVEHLTGRERVHFVNELYRVLVPGGTCTVIVPHWASCRAYGDFTHQWPPVSEFWFYYLSKEWRTGNAPHTDGAHAPEGYTCHFEATWGYAMRQDLLSRNQEYQQFALGNYKEAAQDLVATLTKR